jgi:hypothetical protein
MRLFFMTRIIAMPCSLHYRPAGIRRQQGCIVGVFGLILGSVLNSVEMLARFLRAPVANVNWLCLSSALKALNARQLSLTVPLAALSAISCVVLATDGENRFNRIQYAI